MSLTVDFKEMLRYWGVKGDCTNELMAVAKKAIDLSEKSISPKIVYEKFPVEISDNIVSIGRFSAVSKDLAKCLENSEFAIMLCATVGIGIDNLINRYNGVNMALSTAISAAGSALIETYLDEFCVNLKAEYNRIGYDITPRFSAGYGDLSLDTQKDFFEILNITKRIGVNLNDSLLMTPTKSVTAIIGITKM